MLLFFSHKISFYNYYTENHLQISQSAVSPSLSKLLFVKEFSLRGCRPQVQSAKLCSFILPMSRFVKQIKRQDERKLPSSQRNK